MLFAVFCQNKIKIKSKANIFTIKVNISFISCNYISKQTKNLKYF